MTIKERPILFSTPMVKAILEGRKSQTRRVVKPQQVRHRSDGIVFPRDWPSIGSFTPHGLAFEARLAKFDMIAGMASCPYGRVGDRLWVREAWSIEDQDGGGEDYAVAYEADGPNGACSWFTVAGTPLERRYGEGHNIGLCTERKRPSIHMPRAFSRLTLEVKAVRVERVQDISEADAIAEGVQTHAQRYGVEEQTLHGMTPWYRYDGEACSATSAMHSFQTLWDSINGKSHPWASNPWVWVVEFERVNESRRDAGETER